LKGKAFFIDHIDKTFKINNFTFYITEECNYACSYCYQKRRKRRLKISSIHKTIDFFTPYFADSLDISFYGGEPLLAFNSIEQTLEYFKKNTQPGRSLSYSLTTNGSLLTNDILSILNEFHFKLQLSFDGYSQNETRKENSFELLVDAIETIKTYPNIELTTQSIFIPETVSFLSDSIRLIVDMGVESVDFNLDYISHWDQRDLMCFEQELKKLRKTALNHYNRKGQIPVAFLNKSDSYGISVCE
jgi:uncharacterized protein